MFCFISSPPSSFLQLLYIRYGCSCIRLAAFSLAAITLELSTPALVKSRDPAVPGRALRSSSACICVIVSTANLTPFNNRLSELSLNDQTPLRYTHDPRRPPFLELDTAREILFRSHTFHGEEEESKYHCYCSNRGIHLRPCLLIFTIVMATDGARNRCQSIFNGIAWRAVDITYRYRTPSN